MTWLFMLFLAAISGLIAFISLQPDKFRVSRSASMTAPPEVIFRQINDFHNWEQWSPWAKIDPNATTQFDGSPLGVGSTFSWSGNKEVGVGRMTIVESRQDERLRIKLEFEKPMKATNDVDFVLQPSGDQTDVTWSMAGRNNFIGKAMNLVMNCEKMVGGRYEQGLSNLKTIVEAQAKQLPVSGA